jgi:tRNA(Ile)-lysidine synthase
VSAADEAAPLSAAEAKALFAPLACVSALVLAVSGGPDSTALLMLMARWRSAFKRGPKLIAVTVDHGLRRASAGEARAVKRLARRLGVPHRTVRWKGKKPASGLQEAARAARYRLLAAAAKSARAGAIVTAHTLDDQAETVLLRMSRGSGLGGLCAMARSSPLPANGTREIMLVRPLLEVPKARLVATLARAKIEFADDASNRDPRFTRARLRELMPALAREGLDARRLSRLAGRLRRAEAAIEMAVDDAMKALSRTPWSDRTPIAFDAEKFAHLPAEVGLRLLGRAIAHAGEEGAIRLGKLESLYEALAVARAGKTFRLRRTLGGALVTLTPVQLVVERAPARGRSPPAAIAGKCHNRVTCKARRTTGRN